MRHANERQAWKRAVLRERRTRHPRFLLAVRADARLTCSLEGEALARWSRWYAVGRVLRLLWVDDAFAALVLYRARARGQARGVPFLPRLAHHLSMALAQVCIGDPVVLAPGIALPHGSVVIDGLVEVGPHTVISPSVTIGLTAGDPRGPTIGRGVSIGEGAKVIGSVVIGDGAVVGPNSVVVDDVRAGQEVIGIPAR